jgi:hypothetical protein
VVCHGVVSSFGIIMLLPSVTSCVQRFSRFSSAWTFFQISGENDGGIRKPPSAPVCSLP